MDVDGLGFTSEAHTALDSTCLGVDREIGYLSYSLKPAVQERSCGEGECTIFKTADGAGDLALAFTSWVPAVRLSPSPWNERWPMPPPTSRRDYGIVDVVRSFPRPLNLIGVTASQGLAAGAPRVLLQVLR